MHFLTTVIFICLVLTLFFIKYTGCYYYCSDEPSKQYCKGVKHFICDVESIKQGGTFIGHYPMTRKLRTYLVQKHNEIRNKVASGTETCQEGEYLTVFPKAVRMRELVWDDELAYMASVHAARCKQENDKCHNTKYFRHSGQNVASVKSKEQQTAKKALDKCLDDWYSEKELVPDAPAMANFYPVQFENAIGDFSLLVNDQVSRLGCALAYCRNCKTTSGKPNDHCYFLTCNYDCSNVKNTYVYKVGNETASRCFEWHTTSSRKYRNLCVNTGTIFQVEELPGKKP